MSQHGNLLQILYIIRCGWNRFHGRPSVNPLGCILGSSFAFAVVKQMYERHPAIQIRA